MRGAESVINTFFASRKTGNAALLAQFRHARAPPRQDFVPVSLVAHIPDQAIMRRIENVVQRDGQFHRAEIG